MEFTLPIPVTVMITDDLREWDDPYIAFIEVDTAAHEADFAANLRAVAEAHYHEQFNHDPETGPFEFWQDRCAVILAVMRGHVQVGWGGGDGVDDDTIAEVMSI